MNEQWGHFILIDESTDYNDISPSRPLLYEKSYKNDKYSDDDNDEESNKSDIRKTNVIVVAKVVFNVYSAFLCILNSFKSIASKLSFSKS